MSTYYHGSDFGGLEYEKISVSANDTDALRMQSGPGFYVCKTSHKCRSYGINIYEVTLKKGFRLKKARPPLKLIEEFLFNYFNERYYINLASKLYKDASIRGIEHIYIEIFENYICGMFDYRSYCKSFSSFFSVDGIRLSYPDDSILVLDTSKISVKLRKE